MPGSSCSIACPNMILNTIVAEAFSEFSDILEKSDDFASDLNKLIHDTLLAHHRIIYGGNNYSEEWREEAARRGLENYPTTVEALPHYTDEKNVRIFEKHKVLTRTELASRQEVLLENYGKTVHVEALTLLDLTKKDILPAVMRFETALLETLELKKKARLSAKMQTKLLSKVNELGENLSVLLSEFEEEVSHGETITDPLKNAVYSKDVLLAKMASLREVIDALEEMMPRDIWPFPTYSEILYSVK